jgi:DNA polymerase/3'-5' exonuclease PolX
LSYSIPKYVAGVDQLDREIGALMIQGILSFRLNKRGSRIYGPKNKLLVHINGIGVDIFSSTEENWGMALFIRTGPKEWNIRAMSRFRELGMRGHAYGGISSADGKEISCSDEETVFRYLGWRYVPPEERR